MRISAAYRAQFPPLIVRARVRIISCAFRSRWCGNSAVNGAEIPHDRCISAAYHAISAGHYALPQVAVRKFRTVRFGNLYLYAFSRVLYPSVRSVNPFCSGENKGEEMGNSSNTTRTAQSTFFIDIYYYISR